MEHVDTLTGEYSLGQGVAEEDPCYGRPAFPFPSTLKQANASAAALLGPPLAWVSGSSRETQTIEAGLQKGPLGPGSWESFVSAPPVAREQVYQVF